MSVNNVYVSAACNYVPGAADWGCNKLICYAACNSILIYNPNIGGGKVTHTLNHHTSRVNGVRWISAGCTYETELVSVASDKTAIIWSLCEDKYNHVVLEGHEDVVTEVDALYKDYSEGYIVVVTGSSDSTIKIWERATFKGDVKLKHTIDLGYNIAVSLRITLIPESSELLIAVGNNQSNIQLFIENKHDFNHGSTLSGHEDWVRGLDFTKQGDNLLLASASQDHFVRVWKFINSKNETIISQQELQTSKSSYSIIIDSVLAGHDGWVYSVHWCKDKLLSASLDKSMIVWEFNEDASMWLEAERVGAIGGNTLGFYGGMFSHDGQHMLAHGYHGAFHMWKFDELYAWEPQVTIGGHFKEVTDIAWDPLGYYLMSVSADQTTRIHAQWQRSCDEVATWHEVARPQVHGFDISCLAIIDHYRFVSGAEEKIIRSFQAPQTFVDNFRQICKVDVEHSDYIAPKGASVPSLGLSNKAIYQNDNSEQATVKNKKDMYPEESHFTAVSLTEPPTEENLMQNTLWPEIQKLYGHGYELYALAASPDGKFLASSCKSTTLEHSAVIVWETTNWQIVQKLLSHTLTIAQLAFSPDSRHILSVSRDRRWSLFTKSEDTGTFYLAATTGKDKKLAVHTRIIWCCAWSHDSLFFATGSRDGKVAIWTRGDSEKAFEQDNPLGSCRPASNILELNKESITAVAFASKLIGNDYVFAVGLDSGLINLYKWNFGGFTKLCAIDEKIGHSLTVKRLAFRPGCHKSEDNEDNSILQLASCSIDHTVRIFNITVNK